MNLILCMWILINKSNKLVPVYITSDYFCLLLLVPQDELNIAYHLQRCLDDQLQTLA